MPARKKVPYRDIVIALDATGGLRGAAAKRLGISPATLRRRMQEMQLDVGRHRYIWDLSLRQRIRHLVEKRTLKEARKGDYLSAVRVLRAVDWGQYEINELQRLSDDEVSQMLADWEVVPSYRYERPTSSSAAANGGRNVPRGQTRKHRLSSRAGRNVGRIMGTP